MADPMFDGEEWAIYKNIDGNTKYTVFAHHKSCNRATTKMRKKPSKETGSAMNSWWVEDFLQKCILCDEAVPDEIQALVMLYDYGQETQ